MSPTQLTANGYDAQTLTRLRTELAEAQAAAQRCAALRGKADGLELSRRRLPEQEAAVIAAEADEAQLQAAVATVAVDAATVKRAEGRCTAADAVFDSAH